MKENVNVKRGLAFGFSTVNAGQRQVSYSPQVIATSTDGGFRMTAVVSKLLNLEAGNYVMFITNVDQIDNAIAVNAPEIVAFCEEQGLAVGSPEAMIAIHKAFDVWAVAKGIEEFDAKGNPKTIIERLTKRDRVKFVTAHFEEMMSGAMSSDDEELKAALNADGITVEEQIELLCPFVQARTLPKYKGSKCANPAGLTGIGNTLTFTDSNVWAQLKSDLGENAVKLNRVFEVDTKDILDVEVSNGYEIVTVKAIMLGSYEDEEPARTNSKESAE